MQNIPPPPPGFTIDAQPSGAVYGSPKRPAPQTEAQAEGDVLRNTRTAQEIADAPLNRESTQVTIEDKRQGLAFGPQKHADDLIKSFTADPAVRAYREALPVIISATQAQQGGAGDLSVVYGWAKAMDPNSVVREGEVGMAQSASGPMQRAQFLVSQYRLQEGGSLPPEVRQSLIEEMRTKGRQLNLAYSQKYQQYRSLLERSGLPGDLLGPHAGDAFATAERQYVRQHNEGGVGPTDPNYLAFKGESPQPVGPGDIGFNTPDQPRSMSPDQAAAYNAFLANNPNATPEQLIQFTRMIGAGEADPQRAQEIIEFYRQHGKFAPGEAAIYRLPPEQQALVDERLKNSGATDAVVGGAADTLSVGFFDELSGVADSLANGGSIQANIEAARAFQQGLQDQHGGAYLGGQIAGGLFLPSFGARTAGQLAGVGAGYGAAYGAGSGESVGDRALGAVTSGALGGGIGYGLGRASQYVRGRKRQDVPPLVGEDGRLNEPLEAAGPAARVAAAREFGIDLPMGAAGDRTAALVEKGLDVSPVSAGRMNDARRVAEGQTQAAVEDVASRFGSSRTINEGGSELQRGANEWLARANRVDRKLYEAITIPPKARASVDNTVGTLQQLTTRVQSNPELAAEVNDPTLARYLNAIQNGGLDWRGLKEFRTFIGAKAGEFRFTQDARKDGYRALYGALSEDMRATAAALGPRQLREFERANAFHRAMESRIEEGLVRILGNDAKASPEKAALAVQALAKGGKTTGDLRLLAQVRASTVKSGAWDEIAATLIRLGGQPADSPGRGFNPQTFVQWYADMAEPARAMLFKPELRKTLDQFVAVNQRLANTNALRNTSNTAGNAFGGGLVQGLSGGVGAAAFLMNPLLTVKAAGAAAVAGVANYGMAKLWTNPQFVRWATGYTRAYASGNQQAVKSQIGRLATLTTKNPELRELIESLVRSASNDNASQAGRLAASPYEGPEGEAQPQ